MRLFESHDCVNFFFLFEKPARSREKVSGILFQSEHTRRTDRKRSFRFDQRRSQINNINNCRLYKFNFYVILKYAFFSFFFLYDVSLCYTRRSVFVISAGIIYFYSTYIIYIFFFFFFFFQSHSAINF